MSREPFGPFQKGQPLDLFRVELDAWNEAAKVARSGDPRAGAGGTATQGGYLGGVTGWGWCHRCKNDTGLEGLDLRPGSVVGLEELDHPREIVINQYETPQRVRFSAVKPAYPQYVGRWGIVQQGGSADAVIRVMVAGFSWVEMDSLVDADYVGKHYAEIRRSAAGDTSSLRAEVTGSARIIENKYQTNNYHAVVYFGQGLMGPTNVVLKTKAGGIPARSGNTLGKAACDLFRLKLAGATSDTAELEDTTIDVTVHNLASQAAGGSRFIQATVIDGWIVGYFEDCGG